MALFSEPATIDLENRSGVELHDSPQFIHSKVISNGIALYRLLEKRYGEKNFEIQMRHNVYCIRAPSGSTALSLVSKSPFPGICCPMV